MRITLLNFLLCAIVTVKSSGEFGDCISLDNPIGTHPVTSQDIPDIGTFSIQKNDTTVVAVPLCHSHLGFIYHGKRNLTCRKNPYTGTWRWDHHWDRRSDKPSSVRCSYLKPKSRYLTLIGNFEGCISNSEDVFGSIREEIEPSLTCLQNESCKIDQMECGYNGQDLETKVTLRITSTLMENLTTQKNRLASAVEDLYNSLSRQSRSPHGRQKRLIDGGPSDTANKACDPGSVKNNGGEDGCVKCDKGTYADADNDICVNCALDYYSNVTGQTECTACSDGKQTLSEGSDSAEKCIDVCIVPEVKFSTQDPVASGRVASGESVGVFCTVGYLYNNAKDHNLVCTKDATSNFPASCRKLTVSTTNSVTAAEEGSSLTLTCSSEAADVAPAIKWYKGTDSTALVETANKYVLGAVSQSTSNNIITSKAELEILNAASADAADYKCQVDYADPIKDDSSLDVSITVLGAVLEPSTDQTLSSGSDIKLTCTTNIDLTYSVTEVKWYRESTDITVDNAMTTDKDNGVEKHTLTQESATVANTGTYKCEVTYKNSDGSSTVGPLERTVSVTIRGFSTQPNDVTQEVGREVKLTCEAQGEAQATITWIKVGTPDVEVSSGVVPSFTDPTTKSVLTFTSATTANTGSYKCKADFSGTEILSDAATVTIYDIGITTDPSDAAFLVGDTASLSCDLKNDATLANLPVVEWYKVESGNEVKQDSTWDAQQPIAKSTITFQQVAASNAGEYKCKASYTIGAQTLVKESASAQLYVRELTVGLEDYTMVNLESSTTATLTCKYTGDNQINAVEWQVGGSSTLPAGYTQNKNAYNGVDSTWETTLEITSLTKTSGTAITCVYSGSLGSAITDTTTLVVRKLSTLDADTISSAQSATITCSYEGSDDPTAVTWKIDGNVVTTGDTDITITPGTLSNNAREDTLVVENRAYSDADKQVTCTYSFSNPTGDLSQNTKLIYRGIDHGVEDNTYTTGDAVTLECSLGVGASGTKPASTSWYKDYADSNSQAISGDVNTDTDVTNGLFKTKLIINSIDANAAGSYRCEFKFSDSEIYHDNTDLKVRIASTDPSDATVYSHKNAELVLTCLLSSGTGDDPTGVTWDQPDGVSGTHAETNSNKKSVLTVSNPSSASGVYSCTFAFADGDPVKATFDDVKVELITMLTKGQQFSTTQGTVLTLSCEVGSAAVKTITWYDGTTNNAATDNSYASGKTTSKIELTISGQSDAKTYTCRISADEYSADTVSVVPLELTRSFTDKTFQSPTKTSALVCEADYSDTLQVPTMSWKKGSTPVVNSDSESINTVLNSGGDKYVSTLTVTLSTDSDGDKYTCLVDYTGIAAANQLTVTATTIVVQKVEIDKSYQIIKAGDTLKSICTVTGNSDVAIKWRQGTGNTAVDKTSNAMSGTYSPTSNKLTSTLSIANMPNSDSDDYECYSDFSSGELKATLKLHVVEISDLENIGAELNSAVTFSCTVSQFGATPTVKFYKEVANGDDSELSGEAKDTSAFTWRYTIATVSSSDVGNYYCIVTYQEDGASSPTPFTSDTVSLAIRSIDVSSTQSDIIHTGDGITLSCVLNVGSQSEVSSVEWFKDVTTGAAIFTDSNAQFASSKLTSTYEKASGIVPDDAGNYICKFSFQVGIPIEKSIPVKVHLITALNAQYVNPATLVCEYKGSSTPIFKWFDESTVIDSQNAEFSTSDTTSYGDTKTAVQTLTIDKDQISDVKDVKTIKCEITFGNGETDKLETSTSVHFREIKTFTATQYYTGSGNLPLSCILDYGASGTAPNSVSWTAGTLVKDTDYTETAMSTTNGQASSTITLTNPSNTKFALTYTCTFSYSDSEQYSKEITVNVRIPTMTANNYEHSTTSFTITCSITAKPAPSGVKWYQGTGDTKTELTNGAGGFTIDPYVDVDTDVSLAKANPNSDDSNTYSCEYQFSDGNAQEASHTVTVAHVDMKEPATLYGVKNQPVSLNCEVASDVSLEINWFKGTAKLNTPTPQFDNLNNLVNSVLSVTDYENGVYACGLSDASTGDKMSPEQVDLRFIGLDVQPNPKYFDKEGDTVSITCKVNWYNDVSEASLSAAVAWYLGTTAVTAGENGALPKITSAESTDKSTYDSVLEVEMTTSNVGDYKCEYTLSGANVVPTPDVLTSTVGTLVKEVISGLDNTKYVLAGSSVTLECTVTGDSNVDIVWKKQGENQPLTGNSEDYQSDHSRKSTYTIASPSDSDGGVYTCESNSDSNVKDTVTMDVYETAVHPAEVKSATEAVISCEVKKLDAALKSVAWKDASGAAVSTGTSPGSYNNKMQISTLTATPSADTTYTCVATFANDQTTEELSVAMNVFTITQNPIKAIVATGKTATFSCQLAGNDGTATYSWLNSKTGALVSGKTSSSLEITPSNINDDSTQYTCQVAVTNSGVTSDLFKPDAGSDLVIFSVAISPEVLPAAQDQPSTLTCTITKSSSSATESFKWSKKQSDNSYQEIPNEVGAEYSFTPTAILESGDIACLGQISDGGESSAYEQSSDAAINVFSLTPLTPHTYNPTSIQVTVSASVAPASISWLFGGQRQNTAFSNPVAGEFKDNSIAYTISVDMSQINEGSQPLEVKATLAFTGSNVAPATSTLVYKREFVTALPAVKTVQDESVTLTCIASGENNDEFAIKWFVGTTEILSSDTYAEITDEKVTDSTSQRKSELTLENKIPLYNDEIKCVAKFTNPEDFEIQSSTDLNAIGASMDANSFSSPDGTATISCVVWGNDAPKTVTFEKDDGTVITDTAQKYKIASSTSGSTHTHTLKFLNFGFGQQGDYKCKVVYSDALTLPDMTTKLIFLSASFDPVSPFFVHNGIVQFTCIYYGEADPSFVKWFKGSKDSNNEITDGDKYAILTSNFDTSSSKKTSSIQFKNVEVTDSGDYVCEWENDQHNLMATMTVQIRTLSVDPATSLITIDGSIVISCNYEGVDAPTIEWYHDTTKLSTVGTTTITPGQHANNKLTSTLTITEATPVNNAGDYTCKTVFEDGDVLEDKVSVTVRTVSFIDSSENKITTLLASEGDLTLDCMILADKIPNGVNWYKGTGQGKTSITIDNSNTFVGSRSVQLGNSYKYFSKLTIKNFDMSQEDSYMCEFDYTESDPSATISVFVAKVETEDCVFVDYQISGDKTLECTYHGSNAATKVQFTSPDQQTVDGTLGQFTSDTQTGSYSYTGLTSSSDGAYVCSFTLQDGTISKTINLAARKATLLSGTLATKELVAGSRFTLTCNVDASATSLTWQFKGTENDATFAELSQDNYKDVTSSVQGLNIEHANSIIEIYIPDDTYAGDYQCTGTFQSGECPEAKSFPSAAFTLTVIKAEPTKQPDSGTIATGVDHTLTCIFPDPFGTDYTHIITWYFDNSPILSNGKVYRNQAAILESDTSSKQENDKIETTLTIKAPEITAAGEYKCSAKWALGGDQGNIVMTSNAAVISIQGFVTHPTATNVIKGGTALMTCVASGGSKATITFHKALDDSGVDTVALTENDKGNGVIETTATLTMSSVDGASAGDYYCSAVWNNGSPVKSNNAYLYVFVFEAAQNTAWGLLEHAVQFKCITHSSLMKSATEIRDDVDDTVSAAVVWQYKKSSESTWSSSDDESRFSGKRNFVYETAQTSYITKGSLAADDDKMEVRCVATWTTDDSRNFYGGKLESPPITLNLVNVKEVSITAGEHLVGDTFTFTCIVPANNQPTFTFTTFGRDLNTIMFDVGQNTVQVSKSGDEYTATLAVTVGIPTVASSADGIDVSCNADLEATTGSVSKSVNVKTYYNCDKIDIEIQGKNEESSMNKVPQTDGTYKASTVCPADTNTVRYTKTTTSVTGPTSTCSKTTGKWNPPKLSPCSKILPISTGFYQEAYFLKGKLGFSVCDDLPNGFGDFEAPSKGGFTKEAMIRTLQAPATDEEKCGANNAIYCLTEENPTCTLDTEKTTCSYGVCAQRKIDNEYVCHTTNDFNTDEYDKINEYALVISVGVNFNTPTFRVSEASKWQGLATGVDHVRITDCTKSYASTQRRKREEIIADHFAAKELERVLKRSFEVDEAEVESLAASPASHVILMAGILTTVVLIAAAVFIVIRKRKIATRETTDTTDVEETEEDSL